MDRILVGRFGAAHGVKGEIRLKSFTQSPAAIADYQPLFDASGARRFSIKTLRPLKEDLFIARVAGIEDRASAESLNNLELFAPRAALPPTDEDEFYIADLIGLAAVDASGQTMGRVVDVVNFGAGDILEIAPQAGGETRLFPFTKKVVPEIDMAGGRLTLVPPAEIEAEPSPPQD